LILCALMNLTMYQIIIFCFWFTFLVQFYSDSLKQVLFFVLENVDTCRLWQINDSLSTSVWMLHILRHGTETDSKGTADT
jgi:hypothetical protein